MYDYKFWILSLTGTPVHALGSDSVGYLDKRLSKSNRVSYIHDHAARVNKSLNKGYIGYSLGSSNSFIPFN